MDGADGAHNRIVARTATEQELGHLLDHMEEWQLEFEVGIETSDGAWVATLDVTESDPRRAAFVMYLVEHADAWTIDPAPPLSEPVPVVRVAPEASTLAEATTDIA